MFGRAATRSCSSTSREFALERLHAFRKGIAQSLDDLEQRQVDIGQAAAGDVSPAIGRQQVLEIAEIFRHAFLPEFIGAFLRRRLLILVVQRGAERMMGVVNFQNQIRYRELQLVHPQFAGLRLRRQPVARSQIEQDVGGLPDHQLSVFEERRREGRRPLPRFHHARHRGHAVAAARDVGVAGARLFQREADIFAAALNHWPVIELVTHRWHLRCRVH
jgi:hypothetical protein